jgi:hypothetical protein
MLPWWIEKIVGRVVYEENVLRKREVREDRSGGGINENERWVAALTCRDTRVTTLIWHESHAAPGQATARTV